MLVSTSIFVRSARRHGLLCSGWTTSPHSRPTPRRFSPGAASQDAHPTSIIDPATVVLNPRQDGRARKRSPREHRAIPTGRSPNSQPTAPTFGQRSLGRLATGSGEGSSLEHTDGGPRRVAMLLSHQRCVFRKHALPTVRRSGTLTHQRQIRNTLGGACVPLRTSKNQRSQTSYKHPSAYVDL